MLQHLRLEAQLEHALGEHLVVHELLDQRDERRPASLRLDLLLELQLETCGARREEDGAAQPVEPPAGRRSPPEAELIMEIELLVAQVAAPPGE